MQNKPAVFDRHVHFIQFEDFGEENPLYFNLLRDPVDRFVSNFWWRRNEKDNGDYWLFKEVLQ